MTRNTLVNTYLSKSVRSTKGSKIITDRGEGANRHNLAMVICWETDDGVRGRTYHWVAAGEDGVAGWYDCLMRMRMCTGGVSAGF
jgi:hypothetical protein